MSHCLFKRLYHAVLLLGLILSQSGTLKVYFTFKAFNVEALVSTVVDRQT